MVTAALTLPALAFAAEPAMMKDGMMVDHKGMTLYTFDKDAAASRCATTMREELAAADGPAGAKAEGKWTVIKRDDGTMQWAYDGKPLYTFVKDEKPGDMTGDGMKDVWHVVHESQK